MIWNSENIKYFENEPIGFINKHSFHLEEKKVSVVYKNSTIYNLEEHKYFEIGDSVYTKRTYESEVFQNENDKIERLLIYLEFTGHIAVKYVSLEGFEQIYFSLNSEFPDVDTFSTLDVLYDTFLRHLNINKNTFQYPMTEYYLEMYKEMEKEQEENRANDRAAESEHNFQSSNYSGDNNNTFYNDNLDMDQQSSEYWENI